MTNSTKAKRSNATKTTGAERALLNRLDAACEKLDAVNAAMALLLTLPRAFRETLGLRLIAERCTEDLAVVADRVAKDLGERARKQRGGARALKAAA